jgi:hypothetical protein
VGQTRWFCRNAEEWDAIAERLKLTPCPHCKIVGMLICHDYLMGFDENNRKRKARRARRFFCSNRNARRGCGRTVSVWLADKIRRLSLTAACLWRFLCAAAAGSVLAAIRATDCHLSDRSLQRIWTRFDRRQSQIRITLSDCCQPPTLPAKPNQRPAAQVLAHLQTAFPDADCPITAFQQTMHTFFL